MRSCVEDINSSLIKNAGDPAGMKAVEMRLTPYSTHFPSATSLPRSSLLKWPL